jgi:hypothetical protein
MSTICECKHHGMQAHTYGAGAWRYCGCDGTVHMACDPVPAPSGTPRPEGWPVFLGWQTREETSETPLEQALAHAASLTVANITEAGYARIAGWVRRHGYAAAVSIWGEDSTRAALLPAD